MKPYRIAVCLHGQFRTGTYCLPWIIQTYANAFTLTDRPVEIDYFFYAKVDANSTLEEIHRAITEYNPKKYIVAEHYVNEFRQDIIMARGIANAVNLKQQYEVENNFMYDVCVIQRFDGLLGPFTTSLRDQLQIKPIEPMTVYVECEFFFKERSYKHGVQDLSLIGSNLAIDLLVGEFTVLWNKLEHDKSLDYNQSILIFLKMFSENCSLAIGTLTVQTALVRSTADLTVPVLHSYAYHNEYWTTTCAEYRIQQAQANLTSN